METLTYRKMICNAGHESRPYAEGEALPRKCPICNQPYDRRYNRPVICYEDGSTEEDRSILHIENNDNSHSEQKADPEINEKKTSEEDLDVSQRNTSARPPFIRRGRSMDLTPTQSQQSVNHREGQSSGHDVQLGQRREYPIHENKPSERFTHTASSVLGLYNGGDLISIPEDGCVLGREGYASEYLAINPQVSRKHAFIKADRLGNVFIRDENSLNGTFIDDGNGRRKVKPYETVELKKGDTIWLGNHILIIGTIS